MTQAMFQVKLIQAFFLVITQHVLLKIAALQVTRHTKKQHHATNTLNDAAV